MLVRWLFLLLLLLLPQLSFAQDLTTLSPLSPFGVLNTRDPINRTHPLAYQLLSLWRVLPGLDGGSQVYDPLAGNHGTLTNMGNGFGYQPTTRPGGAGELRFDGTASRVTIADLPIYDFLNQVFTMTLWVRTPSATSQYLLAKRLIPGPGGWFVRVNASGTVTARLLDSNNLNAAERTSVVTVADGAWHHVAVVFQTDTITAANNDLAIAIDGQGTQGVLNGTGNPYNPCTGGCPLTLGSQSDGDVFLLGALDDVRLYARGLLPLEVPSSRLLAQQGDPGLLNYVQVLQNGLVAVSTTQGSFAPFFQ